MSGGQDTGPPLGRNPVTYQLRLVVWSLFSFKKMNSSKVIGMNWKEVHSFYCNKEFHIIVFSRLSKMGRSQRPRYALKVANVIKFDMYAYIVSF